MTDTELATLVRAVTNSVQRAGAIERAALGWCQHTGRPRRECVVFIGVDPVATVGFRAVAGMPVEARAGGRVATVFATARELVPEVLVPLYDARTLHTAVAELRAAHATFAPDMDTVVALVSGRMVSMEVSRERAS